jgi:hypothetical protein
MIVKESISFERGKDPKETLDIGENSIYVKTEVFNKIANSGVHIRLDWDQSGKEKERLIKDIYLFKELIDKLIKTGVSTNEMEISHHDSISIKTKQVMNGNWAICHCLTEEDANILIKAFQKFSINSRENFSMSEDSKYIYVYDKNEWLNDIIENRKKYKNL